MVPLVGSPPTWGDVHIQAQVTGKAGLDLSPSASQGTLLHKPHVQRAVDFSATFHRCVCVCVCTCVNKENTLPSPGALSWPLPLPLLSLNKRLVPGRLCPLLHSEPCQPIHHCVPFTLHRGIYYVLSCGYVFSLSFHTSSAISYVGSREEPQSMTLRHQLDQKLPRPSAHTSVSPLITWD